MGQASQRRKILKPLEVLGLDKISNIEEALEKKFGKERALEITKEWDRLSAEADLTDVPGSQNALYEYLHKDPELSMIVSCYTDATIIRAFCLWLYDHRSLFGNEILDVGCGTGIISCFLAGLLPEAHITAVDRSESCIQTAEWIRQKINVSNIEFRCASAEEMKGESFDTVLSIRTFHENIGVRKTALRFLPFSKQIESYKGIYEKYCGQLGQLVKEDGTLICMERNHMDTELLSFFYALSENGLSICPETISSLQCEESDFAEPSEFQAFAAQKDSCSEENIAGTDSLFAIWKEKAFSKSEDPEYFTRSQVDCFVEKEAAGLIEGYETFGTDGGMLAKACLLKKKDDPDHFLMYQANYGQAGVQVLPYEALEEAKEVFADHKAVDAARGFAVKNVSDN